MSTGVFFLLFTEMYLSQHLRNSQCWTILTRQYRLKERVVTGSRHTNSRELLFASPATAIPLPSYTQLPYPSYSTRLPLPLPPPPLSHPINS